MLELRRTVLGRPPPPPADHDAHHRPIAGAPPGAPAPVGMSEDAGWEPPIVRTVAVRGEGIDELAAAVDRHRAHLEASGGRAAREASRARAGFVSLLRERLLAGALARLEAERGHLDEIAARIAAREADPYALVDELAARLQP
jgi:LAO/AO transport system kinase